MDLNYIDEKLKEIHSLRLKILKEMNMEYTNASTTHTSTGFMRTFSDISNMRMACIMDEFTFQALNPECQLLQITPQSWHQEFEEFKPHLFFVESAWRGINNLWNMKVNYLSDELIDIFGYCRKNNIPIVFWNKEDPVHFDTFIETSKQADFVFTTDIDCVRRYKTVLQHERVFLMPFAAQPKYHNPIEITERKDKFCFAGAYYRRFPERKRDLETFVGTVTELKGLDIYDRNFHNTNSEYTFPRSYKRYIRGSLKTEDIDKAYKGYRFNINMNSVKQSQSMCARRIFELLASNTVTVSNYSRAIRNIFGDLVVCTDDDRRLRREIQKFDESGYYAKYRLSGLRKVHSEHTYRDRLLFLVNKVFDSEVETTPKKVAVLARVNTLTAFKHIVRQFKRQLYKHKQLFVVTEYISNFDHDNNDDDVQIVHDLRDTINFIQRQYDYAVFLSASDYYGVNYIGDFILATKYTDHQLISKATYFTNNNGAIIQAAEGPSYQTFRQPKIRRSFIHVDRFSQDLLTEFVTTIDEGFITGTCMSIDSYNYCENYSEDRCEIVDDLIFNDIGVSMHTINAIVDQIKPGKSDFKSFAIGSDLGCFVNKSKVLLIADNYPDYSDLYRYAFIHSRLMGYKNKGLVVDVFKCSDRYPKGYAEFEGIDISCGYIEELNSCLASGNYETLLIHFLTETIWNGIKNSARGKKIIVWVHGAEIQPWWRREFNYTDKQQLEQAKRDSEIRVNFWSMIFKTAMKENDLNIHFVFVSNYFAGEVFEDLQITLPKNKYSVIHNYVNSDLFRYNGKGKELRKKVLSIRPFTSRKYANDLTVKAILELAKTPIFSELEFRIVGKGELYKSTVKPIKKYKNVILEEKFLRQDEIAELHQNYGVFLNPTRWDSQGVSRDEAMSSGLVPVTNSVSAIPEFMDSDCGMLVDSEDYKGLAESIVTLYHNPDLFLTLSQNSAERVRLQSGMDETIIREIELITS